MSDVTGFNRFRREAVARLEIDPKPKPAEQIEEAKPKEEIPKPKRKR